MRLAIMGCVRARPGGSQEDLSSKKEREKERERRREREGEKKQERFRLSRAVTRTIAKDRETILSPGRNPFCGFSPFPLDNGPIRGEGGDERKKEREREIEFATSVNCAGCRRSRIAIEKE